MIGLDLATTRGSSHGPSASISNEMISTPKMQTPNGILSPRFSSFCSTQATRTSTMANGIFDCSNSNGDDVLMTPVLNTPKNIDVWSERKHADVNNFSPETPNSVELVIREPPRNLPMDSDIGLRSPCDGLLAKRRKQMRELNRKPESFNSDSNSCDTTISENSPKDLTTGPPRSLLNCPRISLNGTHNAPSPASAFRVQVPSSPRNLPAVLPPPLGDRRYEDFKHPACMQNYNAIKENDLPAHINPSPLAVPSPNWSAVECFFGIEPIRTPKNITVDNSCFDFLGLPPGTPRSASRFKDRSPNPTMDCYSGRDQRLSPRLSPRFPIPESPTDLSGRAPLSEENNELQTSNEVQDLSTRSLKLRSASDGYSESASSSSPSLIQTVLLKHSISPPPPSFQSSSLANVKSEVSQRLPLEIHKPRQSQKSVISAYPTIQQQASANEFPVERIRVKTETMEGMISHAEDYDFPQPVSHQPFPQPSSSFYQNPFYLSGGFNHCYQRGLYNSHHDLEHSNQTQTTLTPRAIFEHQSYHTSQLEWNSTNSHPHHHSVHQHLHPQHQSMSHSTSGESLIINTQSWSAPIKEEPPITPPPMTIVDNSTRFKPSFQPESLHKGKHVSKDVSLDKRKNQKKPDGEAEEKRGRKKGKGKPRKEIGEGPSGENKRQYVCQYCQRSYDWNYNLNRHQKYECGKENAFQCAKCGRKFPHKQNCVYHLKRKHKVVYETIDQYMTAGLVTFRGSSDPTGHSEAIPISQISSM